METCDDFVAPAPSPPPETGVGHDRHRSSLGIGGPGDDLISAIAIDDTGRVYVGGSFRCSLMVAGTRVAEGPADLDIFIAGFESDGSLNWVETFSGTGTDLVRALSVGPDGHLYLSGSFEGDLTIGGDSLDSAGDTDGFIASLDADGNARWFRNLGGPGQDEVTDSTVSAAGRMVVTGLFSETGDFGGPPLQSMGRNDVLVASYDALGRHEWSARFGDRLYDRGRAVGTDDSDNIFLTGWSESRSIDLGGGPVEESRAFVVSFTGEGVHRWSRPIGGYGPLNQSDALAVDALGQVYVGGTCQGTGDFGGGDVDCHGDGGSVRSHAFILGLDRDGGYRWAHTYGSAVETRVGDLVVDTGGNVYAAGHFGDSVDFGGGSVAAFEGERPQDLYIVSFTDGGEHRSTYAAGSAGSDWAGGLAIAPDGAVWAVGHFVNAIDFGGGGLRGAGDDDGFLLALEP